MTPDQCRARFDALPQLVFIANHKNGDPSYVHVTTGQVYRLTSVRQRTGLISSDSVAGIAMFVAMEHPNTGEPAPALEAVLKGPGAEKVLAALEAEASRFRV